MPGLNKNFNPDKYISDFCFNYLNQMSIQNIKHLNKGIFRLIYNQLLTITNNIWKHYGNKYPQKTIETLLSISFKVFVNNISRIINSKHACTLTSKVIKIIAIALYEIVSDKLLFDKPFNYTIIEMELNAKLKANKLLAELQSEKTIFNTNFNYYQIINRESTKYKFLCANLYSIAEKDLICKKITYFCNLAGETITSNYYISKFIYTDISEQDVEFLIKMLAKYVFKVCITLFNAEIKDEQVLNFILYKIAAEVWEVIFNNLRINNDYRIIEKVLEKKYEACLIQCIRLVIEIKQEMRYQLNDIITNQSSSLMTMSVYIDDSETILNYESKYKTMKTFIEYKLYQTREKFSKDFYNSAAISSKIYIDNIIGHIDLICNSIINTFEKEINATTVINILIDSLYERIKAYYMLNQDLLFVYYKLKKYKSDHIYHILTECIELDLLNFTDLIICLSAVDSLGE